MSKATAQSLSQPARSIPAAHVKTPILLRALNWLAEKDGNYRQAAKLRDMDDERLTDMGITRAQANQAFYQLWGNKRANLDPIKFGF